MSATTAWEGRFLSVRVDGQWEYVTRARGIGAAVILALDAGEVILVEQYRVPLGSRCLELPAGLVGDEGADEPVEVAAARELEEETGYRADWIAPVGFFHSSPGMVSEGFTLLRATGLTKVGDGGGDSDENITVHRVPIDRIADFVATKRAEGVAIDVKLLILLGGALFATA